MKLLTRAGLALASLSLLFTTGCAMAMSPVTGFVYSDVKAPLAVNSDAEATKTGEAKCTSILGLVAQGDASIEAAAKAGGIKKIHSVDYKCHSILGFYAEFTTIVHGE
jgi:hypothetical protein